MKIQQRTIGLFILGTVIGLVILAQPLHLISAQIDKSTRDSDWVTRTFDVSDGTTTHPISYSSYKGLVEIIDGRFLKDRKQLTLTFNTPQHLDILISFDNELMGKKLSPGYYEDGEGFYSVTLFGKEWDYFLDIDPANGDVSTIGITIPIGYSTAVITPTSKPALDWKMVSDNLSRKEIFIGQSFDYVDDLGYLHIVGEIVNNKNEAINFVKVVASLYDSNKNFVDTNFTFTVIDIIPPYGKAPFDIVFAGGSQGIKSYDLQVEYVKTNPLPMELKVTKPRMFEDELGYIHLKGVVENSGERTAHFVKVIGNLYDSNKNLLGTSFTFTTLRDIYPNQSSPYDLIFTDVIGNPTLYQIYVQSQEYGMTYQYSIGAEKKTEKEFVGTELQENQGTKTEQTGNGMSKETPKLLKCGEGTVEKDGECVPIDQEDGGCLIATATFGSELAPQVQQLREIRDNSLMQTQSGKTFMEGFNVFYYSFSPTIADWERQNLFFKETVKLAITPLITTLSLLQYTNIDSEAEMLGYGIGIIMLNVGIYFITPMVIVRRMVK